MGAAGGLGNLDVTTSGSEAERMVAERPAIKKLAKKLGSMKMAVVVKPCL